MSESANESEIASSLTAKSASDSRKLSGDRAPLDGEATEKKRTALSYHNSQPQLNTFIDEAQRHSDGQTHEGHPIKALRESSLEQGLITEATTKADQRRDARISQHSNECVPQAFTTTTLLKKRMSKVFTVYGRGSGHTESQLIVDELRGDRDGRIIHTFSYAEYRDGSENHVGWYSWPINNLKDFKSDNDPEEWDLRAIAGEVVTHANEPAVDDKDARIW
ncbi:uncharacterized protein I206_107552 [Kwoniella pini CBS 10737]|uniref:Uncharacterized protein n=1 Tax=Kwoniella pini CBS 10737 TaxID=1296096 RepID=A0A1B9HXK6_9TREE|nr:uncharacterized protein I206_05882 [Kwoniella pini CBS 10737]OCF48015.1 hypothetical protein I206_05882 [Kwoniella pini CBS 10737]